MRWIRATAAAVSAAALAVGPAAAQHGAPADGEWRSYAGGQREHEVLAARPDHGRELRRPRGALALEVGRHAPGPFHPRRRLAGGGRHPVRPPAGGGAGPLDRVGRGAADAHPAVHPRARGDAAPGGRRPVSQHAALPGGGRRRPHRRDPVGARPAGLRVGDAGHRAVAASWRGLLGERNGDARIVWATGDGFLLAVDAQDRHPRPRVRRQRARRSPGRRAAHDARRAGHPEPPAALVAVAPARHPRHHHRRLDHQRPAPSPARRRPGSPAPTTCGPAATGGTSTPCRRARTSSGRTPGWTSRGATVATRTSGR